MSPEQEVQRGNRAQQILDDPLVKAALDDIGNRIIEQWRACPVKDVELREKLWMMFNVRHAFIDAMREHIDTGKLAKKSLIDEAERKSFMQKMKEKYSVGY
jgi:hypothetical protein